MEGLEAKEPVGNQNLFLFSFRNLWYTGAKILFQSTHKYILIKSKWKSISIKVAPNIGRFCIVSCRITWQTWCFNLLVMELFRFLAKDEWKRVLNRHQHSMWIHKRTVTCQFWSFLMMWWRMTKYQLLILYNQTLNIEILTWACLSLACASLCFCFLCSEPTDT